MANEKMHHELKKLIADVVEIDDFNDDDDFFTKLEVDSMMALEIMARTEQRYHIRIPETYFTKMRTLNDLMSIVTTIMQAA
jgi:acyl carrier protein